MFGMSFTEVMVILVVALVFMGPEKIPEAARFLGKMMREVRKASNLLRDAIAIEDPPLRPAPISPGLPQASPAATVMRDPDPRLDVRMATMRPVQPVRLQVVELAAADPPQLLRETYLHVPYDETI